MGQGLIVKRKDKDMGLFSSVEQADVTGGGVYFLPGEYVVEIDKVKTVRSQRNNKDYWIVETTILESDNEERPADSHASQVVDISNIMGPVNIKAFVAAASGIDPQDPEVNEKLVATWEELTEQELSIEQICELICDEDENPLQGLKLHLECRNIKTRSTGNDFTKHFWSPMEEDESASEED